MSAITREKVIALIAAKQDLYHAASIEFDDKWYKTKLSIDRLQLALEMFDEGQASCLLQAIFMVDDEVDADNSDEIEAFEICDELDAISSTEH